MLRKLLIIAALCVAATAQMQRYDSQATATTGQPGSIQLQAVLPGSTAYVCTGSTQPCGAPGTASLFSDIAGTVPIAQPLVADASGRFGFFWSGATITLTITPPTGSIGSAQSYTYTSPLAAQQISVATPSPYAPGTVSVVPVGTTGSTTYYYWVVSNFTIGNSAPSLSAVIKNAAGTLSSINYDKVTWTAATGANTYDVLRTTSATAPTGACACAVATAVNALTANDQSNSLNAYTVNTYAGNTTFNITNVAVGAGESKLTFAADHGAQFIVDNINGASFGSLSSSHPSITPTSIEQVQYADQFGNLQAAISNLPAIGGTVRMACGSTGTNAFAVPIVVVTGAVKLIGCGHDESGNGSQLTFTPPANWDAYAWVASGAYAKGAFVVDSNGDEEVATVGGTAGSSAPSWPTNVGGSVTDGGVTWVQTGPPAAITAVNAYGLVMHDFSLSQGNTVSATNGLSLVGVHDADLQNFYIGETTGSNDAFSNTELLLADSSGSSSIYNSFRNFSVIGGNKACELLQSNSGKVVNANTFMRGVCAGGSAVSLYLGGNASENTFVNMDVSGNAPTQVSVGDSTTTQCRDDRFIGITEEAEAPPTSQIGFKNYCNDTYVETEGSMGGVSPVLITDESGAQHIYIHGAGTPSSFGVGWESTLYPLEWTATTGGVGIGVAPAPGGGLNLAASDSIYANGTKIATVKATGWEFSPACAGFDGSVGGVTYFCGPATGSGGVWTLPSATSDFFVGVAATQTLNNKTLASPTLTGTATAATLDATTLEQGSQAITLAGANGLSAGTISVASSTSGSHAFSTAYTAAPICTVTEAGSTPAGLNPAVTSSTTAVTVTVAISGSYTFDFLCAPTVN